MRDRTPVAGGALATGFAAPMVTSAVTFRAAQLSRSFCGTDGDVGGHVPCRKILPE